MKSCADYQEWISAMLDGELTDAEQSELAAHIAHCPDCKVMYAAFAAVSELEREEVPDTLHEAVMTEVTAARKAMKTQGTLRRLRPILATAACLVVIVGSLFAVKNMFRAGSAAPAAAPTAAEAPASAAGADASAEETVILTMMAPEAPAEPAAAAEAESERNFFYAADSAAASVPELAVESASAAKAAPETVTVEIDALTDGGFTAADTVTDTALTVLLTEDTEMTDAVRSAIAPGCIVTVEYTACELCETPTIYAEAVYLTE